MKNCFDDFSWEFAQFSLNPRKSFIAFSLPFFDSGKSLITPSLPLIGSSFQSHSLLIIA